MDKWVLETKLDYNKKEEYGQRYLEELFANDEKVSSLIRNLLDLLHQEILSIASLKLDLTQEEAASFEAAMIWIDENVEKLKKELLQMGSSISSNYAFEVFQLSMDRLFTHFRRRKKHWRQGGEFDAYLEWLLELPYLVRERVKSASVLEPKVSHPTIQLKVKSIKSEYAGNLEVEEIGASSEELALCC